MPDTIPVPLPSDTDPNPRDFNLLADRGGKLADAAIADLHLVEYVQSWNNGDPDSSLITSLEGLRIAVYVGREKLEAFDGALDAADAQGVGVFYMHALGGRLDVTITSSTLAALLRQASEWADELIRSRPAEHGLRGRFRTKNAFLNWTLAEVHRPMFCGPDGREIITNEIETTFLRLALLAALTPRARARWIER